MKSGNIEVEKVDMSANELISYRKKDMKRKIEKIVQVGEERKRKAFFMNKLISQIVAETEENE